jgi:replicative DNA helicase
LASTFSNPDAEIVVLASMLQYPEACAQAAAMGMTPAHFADRHRGAIAKLILELAGRGELVQPDVLYSRLFDPKLHAVATDLASSLSMPRKNIDWHVRELKEKTRRRRLVEVCERAIRTAEDAREDTASCFSYLSESLLEIEAEARASVAVPSKDFLPAALERLKELAKKSELVGFSTGIVTVDEVTAGIRPGELWIYGALPGRGKTAMGTQSALENAQRGTPVAFFSLEMTTDELAGRLLCHQSSVSASCIRNPRYIRDQQWRDLEAQVRNIGELPLYIDDSPAPTIQELTARARLYIRRFGCRLLVIDYLRLVDAPGKELRERLANIVDALRQLAKSEQVGVVGLSQLSRPRDGDLNARPNMLQLKESGDIEAHAHVVLLSYMPTKNDEPTGEEEILIGKNRHGPMGSIPVTFDRMRLKFLPRQA